MFTSHRHNHQTYNEHQLIYEHLLKLTREGKLEWTSTATYDHSVKLGDDATVRVHDPGISHWRMWITHKGQLPTRLKVSRRKARALGKLVQHDQSQRSTSKTVELMDSTLKALESQAAS